MKTKNKIIVFLSIFSLIIASIIIGRAFINSKIDDAIKKARNRPIDVVSYTVKESDFYQSIETFGTAIANKSFSKLKGKDKNMAILSAIFALTHIDDNYNGNLDKLINVENINKLFESFCT